MSNALLNRPMTASDTESLPVGSETAIEVPGISDERRVLSEIKSDVVEHFTNTMSRQERHFGELFEYYARVWQRETLTLSALDDVVSHPCYRAIIGIGKPMVPFIMRDMMQNLSFWFDALEEITGENPVPPEHFGRVKLMRDDWINWGQHKGYVS